MTVKTLTSNQLSPGTTISLDGGIYRVESAVKVTVAKATPFIKTTLKNLMTDQLIEKNFKEGQTVEEVSLSERQLEYLYVEGKDYLFLDVGSLDTLLVPRTVIGDKVNYLKEGIELKAMFYGDTIFSVELPQFLELMVVKIEGGESSSPTSNATKKAFLETGAEIEVPLFIEVGDITKIDTFTNEFVQRV